jgi:heme-degrading monooxygenase HmoA
MVTMITLHMLSKDNRKQAMEILRKNTELAQKAKGFVSRQVFISANDPLKGYSITTWKTREDMENFRKNPERPPLMFEGEERRIYEKTSQGNILVYTHTENDTFELVYGSY